MAVNYQDRANRLHQPIAHDPRDCTPLDTALHPSLTYHKRALAIQNLMVYGRDYPFDMIRRCAEEIDAMFSQGTPPAAVPKALRTRAPEYFERRVLALERFLQEQGFVTAAEIDAIAAAAEAQGDKT